MMTKRKVAAIVAGSILAAGVVITGAAVLAANLSGHNWSLGLAGQKSDEDITKVQQSLEAIDNEAVLDVYVKNANTSGTPFGHSIAVRVLVDTEMVPETEDMDAVETAVRSAIASAGVKDTFDILLGVTTEANVISGQGSAEQPITSARDVSYGAMSRDFQIKY